ncbi:hypothetical protein NM208_g2073 [Fusarium decemcellulare]|uniref:Uncharacterized protein n=1 Tax=Fusarium decemcellulare TaxID=57161 RepID=A0ACC1SU25_9HYPO|nr:hypothetical protein NM208_g2073 [Fusarium decemcellulare]
MEHESFFSYPVTRPFPFRWFTPVAVVGGIAFLALFTFMNFASSSYELIVQDALDPNATVSGRGWLHRYPSFLATKVRPTCQPASLPVNSQLFTNNTALTYTLTSVWRLGPEGDQIISPTLTYNNNVLRNCSINSVEIDFSSLDRSGNQIAFCEWGAVIRSYVTCQIDTPAGDVFFDLIQTYDYVPATISFDKLHMFLGSGFLSRNQTTRASLWWGESLISTYWGGITLMMQNLRGQVDDDENKKLLTKGTVSFTTDESYPDIQDLRFFKLDYRFIGTSSNEVICCPELEGPLTAQKLNESDIYPNIWITADTLAKAVYSTILVDLGQTRPESNILTDTKLLTHFTSGLSTIQRANLSPGPANDSYSVLKKSTGPLRVTPSVISTAYICQVPRLKPAGNLIVAILVADLVLLQAVWQLYKLATEAYLTRTHPDSNSLRVSSVEHPEDSAAPSMQGHGSDIEYFPLVDTPGQNNHQVQDGRAGP